VRFLCASVSVIAATACLFIGPSPSYGQLDVPHCGLNGGCGSLTDPSFKKWLPVPDLTPFGVSLRSYQDLQTAKGRFDRFFVHQHEWYLGGKTLGPFGRRHISRLADELVQCPFRVYLTPSEDAKLDAARRIALVQAFKDAGLVDAQNRVSIAYSNAEGLYGEEGVRIYPRLFFMRGGQGGSGGQGGMNGGFGGGSSSGGLFGGSGSGRGY
jgi:uncharacterized membrane protein YgcG